jgi:hypothetical protein
MLLIGLGLCNNTHYITLAAIRTATATNYEYTQSMVLLVPCQFTPLLNLRSHVFDLTPFRWLGFIMHTTVTPPRF